MNIFKKVSIPIGVLLMMFSCISEVNATDIKVILVTKIGDKDIFISGVDFERTAEVLNRIKNDKRDIRGVPKPHEYWIYYWIYSEKDRELKKQAYAFIESGRSVNLIIQEGDSKYLMSLFQKLYQKTKTTEQPPPN